MKHLMIDIETLGSSETAMILSIGAVPFDATYPPNIKKGFYVVIDLESSLKFGRTIDGNTLKWWINEGDKLKQMYNVSSAQIMNHMDALGIFYDYCSRVGADKVWANGVNFDIKILEQALDAAGYVAPWRYGDVCCMRSLRAMEHYFPLTILEKPWNLIKEQMCKDGKAHNALEDAFEQAKYVHTIMKNLNNGKSKHIPKLTPCNIS